MSNRRRNDTDLRDMEDVFEDQDELLVEIDDNGEIVQVPDDNAGGRKPVVIRDPHGEY